MIALLAAGVALATQPNGAVLGALRADGHCAAIGQKVRSDQQQYFERLGRLPPAYLEYAVMRTVQGCMVPAPVGYHPPAPKPAPKDNG